MGPGTDAFGARTRKDNEATGPNTLPASNTPTSFRMATEDQLEATAPASREPGFDSTYGVQSLQDTIYEATPETSDQGHIHDEEEDSERRERRHSTANPKAHHPHIQKTSSIIDGVVQKEQLRTAESSPSRAGKYSNVPSMSQSLTSLSLDSQAPLSSVPSSPKSYSHRSFRPSDEESMDEAGSQAIISSSEDEARPPLDTQNESLSLIMPSIKMPSRRPFTERGKAMGRLKVLIAGDSGVGKSSLIRSIVQTCEDVVHVDPLLPNVPSIDQPSRRKSKSKQPSSNNRSTQTISEIHASTKPYPSWWSEIEDTKLLRRRKSSGDTVLERNLCFVDTPGYSSGMSKMETIDIVVQYVEGQLKKSFSASSGEGDIVGLMSGNGGSQVDIVFYMISQDIKHEDIVFIERLTAFTNVILLISKSDTLSLEETEVLRRSVTEHLNLSGITLFQFAADDARQSPFTVCSAPSDDDDNMDASLLMSSDYVQPLVASELSILIRQILEKDSASCLRHLAATKLVQAERCSMALTYPASIPRTLSNPIAASSKAPPPHSPQTMVVRGSVGVSSFVQARIADHTQQEERMAQVRLAKWATDLQRSLQNERLRYEALSRGERVDWLNEKMEEVALERAFTKDSALIRRPECRLHRRRSGMAYQYGLMDVDDPLGLLQWNELMRQRGWVALQVAGGFGILGAVAVWIARTWSLDGNEIGNWNWPWLRDN